ncbi:hypothetical protein ACO0SA_001276 [Hanseniaspora valbyensis]
MPVSLTKEHNIWDSLAEKLEENHINEVLRSLRENYQSAYEINDPGHCGIILDFLNILILDLEINYTIEYIKSVLLVFFEFEEEEIDLFYDVYFINERFTIRDLISGKNNMESFSIDNLVLQSSKFLDCRVEEFFEFLFDAPPAPLSLLDSICESTNQWYWFINNEKQLKSNSDKYLNLSLFFFKYDIACSLLKFGQDDKNKQLDIETFNNTFQTNVLNGKFYKVFKVLTDPSVKNSYIAFLIEFCAIDYYDLFQFLYKVNYSKKIKFSDLVEEFPNENYISWLQFFDKKNLLSHFKLFDRLFIDFVFDAINLNEFKFLKHQSFLLDEFADNNGFLRSSRNSKSLWIHYTKQPHTIEKKLLSYQAFFDRKNSEFVVSDFVHNIFLKKGEAKEELDKNVLIEENNKLFSKKKTLPQKVKNSNENLDVSNLDIDEITLSTPLKFKVDYMDEQSSEQFNFDYNVNKFILNISDNLPISTKQEKINEKQIADIKASFDTQKVFNICSQTTLINYGTPQNKDKDKNEIVIMDSEELELEKTKQKKTDLSLQGLLHSLMNENPLDQHQAHLINHDRNTFHENEKIEEDYGIFHENSDENLMNKNKRIKVSMYETPKYKYYLKMEKFSSLHEMFITPDKLLHAILQEKFGI